MMNFLQLSALSLEAWAMGVALLKLLEVIMGGVILKVATKDVFTEMSSMKKHAKKSVLTMETFKDKTLHRPVPRNGVMNATNLSTIDGAEIEGLR